MSALLHFIYIYTFYILEFICLNVCVSIPKMWTIPYPKLFSDTNFFWYQIRYHPKNWKSFETEKFRNRNVTLWLEGIPLTLETLVEDGFTHEISVSLHLEIISSTMSRMSKKEIDVIWKTMFEEEATIGIPGAQSITLSWLCRKCRSFGYDGRNHLLEKLRSCADAIKALPEYIAACNAMSL